MVSRQLSTAVVASVFLLSLAISTAPAQVIISACDSTQLPQASIWGTISFDGSSIGVITTQQIGGRPHLFLRRLDTAFVQQGALVQLTSDADPSTAKGITDHKHIFLGGEYFITFSVVGDSDLYLMKADISGHRIGSIIPVVERTADRTNDMFLTTDGTDIFVGYFHPPSQTVFYRFQRDLFPVGPPITTSNQLPHNNIGSAVFKDGYFYMFTGSSFGQGANLILTRWNQDWTPAAASPQVFIASANGDGNWFATGAAYDILNKRWYVGFQHIYQTDPDEGEHIDIAVFDTSFALLERQHAVGAFKYRPDFLLNSQRLYMTYDQPSGVFLRKYIVQAVPSPIIDWRPYFTLQPNEGVSFVVDSTTIVPNAGVPGLNIANDGRVILGWGHYTEGGRNASVSLDVGRTFTQLTGVQQPDDADGAFIYLPNGWTRFLAEELMPGRPPNPHKSQLISYISSDGLNWVREAGIRYQPGALDDSICSVPSALQVRDSVWRLYYVGDWYRTNGTRTAISTDWGWTWTAESGTNVLRNGDVDPHPVHLSDGRVRLYHRHGSPPSGVAFSDGDGVAFDTTLVHLLVRDGSANTPHMLDPAVIKYPNGSIACYIGAAPNVGQTVPPPKIIAAWANAPSDVRTEGPSRPTVFTLHQNYPNPFNPATTISFSLPFRAFVTLKVYDVLGREVGTVVSQVLPPGNYSSQWDASRMSSGVYFYRLQAGTSTETKKLVLLR
jgi:hypothetical protein